MSDNFFSKGCLVRLETSAWTARRKIPSRALLENHADVDPRFVNASKRLVDSKSLSALEAVRSEARAWLYAQSLPFPLDGAVFVPTGEVERIDAKLAEFAARYDEAVNAFVAEYGDLRLNARAQLGSLYSETDYPSNVRDRFSFAWSFLSLAPASEAQLLSPKLVAQERAKFQRLMAEASQAAVTELRTRFAACVDHMVERLTPEDGKPKVFRDSLVGNLREFLDSFAALNVCDDGELAQLVTRSRELIDGVDAGDLRENDTLRERVAQQMAAVQGKLDDMITDRPTRKLRLAPAPVAEAS